MYVSLGFASESAIVENFRAWKSLTEISASEGKGFWGRVLARDRSKIMSYTSFKRFRAVWQYICLKAVKIRVSKKVL